MAITVGYTSQLKLALGIREEQLEIATPCTIDQLLDQLVARHGEPLRRLVGDGDQGASPALVICLGDEQIRPGDSTPIRAGDSVTLLAPIGGG